MDSISFPDYWHEASAELAAGDPVMAGFVDLYSGDSLVSRGDPFGTLVRSIVGQQISVKAADSIWARFSSTLSAIDCSKSRKVVFITPWPVEKRPSF